MEEILGTATIIGKDGNAVALSEFTGAGKRVFLYFSAHWCPPCRGFTPMLIEFYNHMKKREEGANIEIVFLSSDKDEEAFNSYYKDMPWLALKYDERDLKGKISERFGVRGIPTLVLLNGENGETISTTARNDVQKGEDHWNNFSSWN